MSYQIYSKNLEVTAVLKEYVDLKMKKLNRFLKIGTHCQLDLSRDVHHKKGEVYRAEMNIEINNKVYRVEESASDIRQALDVARDKMFLQLSKTKEKKDSAKKRRGDKK